VSSLYTIFSSSSLLLVSSDSEASTSFISSFLSFSSLFNGIMSISLDSDSPESLLCTVYFNPSGDILKFIDKSALIDSLLILSFNSSYKDRPIVYNS